LNPTLLREFSGRCTDSISSKYGTENRKYYYNYYYHYYYYCFSLVDGAGAVIYDTFVAPLEPVTDYRTRVR
jgi:hypothetical protein